MKRRRAKAAQVERGRSRSGDHPRRRVEPQNPRNTGRVEEEATDVTEEEGVAEVSRVQHRRTLGGPRPSTNQSDRPNGFAYLKEDIQGAPVQQPSATILPTTSTVVAPSPKSSQKDTALDDASAEVTSPRSARSVTRGFSHLRESVFFALPKTHTNMHVTECSRESIVLPLFTPPQVSASRSSLSSSHSEHASLVRQERRPNHYNRHHKLHGNGSDNSFLSTHSAIEYINSTVSAGEMPSSRGSMRSSQVTTSLYSASKSTLEPLDLSPILKEERLRRRRRCGGSPARRPPLTRLPIDVPAAVVRSSTLEGKSSGGESLEELNRSLASCSRVIVLFVFTLFLITVWGLIAAPLIMRLDGPDDTYVRHYVDSVAELQFIYKTPYMSLSTDETRQLYFRVLSETFERLDRATSHLKPNGEPAAQILHYKRMIKAYQAVRQRARLYARSRDRSRLQQLIISPMRDVWRYGVLRHGHTWALRSFFWEQSLSRLWTQLTDIALCIRQDENMPCPSLDYLQEEQQKDSGHSEMSDADTEADHPEMAEVRRLKRLLDFIAESFRRRNREYNHMHLSDSSLLVSS